ncbi:hypothetical protein D7Y26_09490 [Stenotrophomonas maltophilia]|nr:hypothetical protein [Stenotrophomonas maltophilia]MBA0323852.1 hypothetical protein [Stenotrophomonas maltophilia]
MDQSAQAAWVQAVFSVVGIGVAILVPYLQHRNAAKTRASEARALAISQASALIRDVKIYANRADAMKSNFDERNLTDDAWRLSWPAPPDEVKAAAATLHELGQPGTNLTKAIHHSLEAKDLLDVNGYLNANSAADYGRHLIAVQTNVHAALREMRTLLES